MRWRTSRSSFFQSNQFWPLADTLAFSDALVGYAPAGLIGSGVEAAVARYALLYLFAYALCFAGAALLARELGAGRAPSMVAGAAFAFAPWRMEQAGHLHVISSGGIPLSLFLAGPRAAAERPPARVRRLGGRRLAALDRMDARASARLPAGGPWPSAPGTCGGRDPVDEPFPADHRDRCLAPGSRRGAGQRGGVVAATIAGMVLFGGTGALLARPYLRVADAHPEARRGPGLVASYSEGPHMFIAAPRDSLVWAGATEPVRERLDAVAEQTLFPGPGDPRARARGRERRALPAAACASALGAGALGSAALALGFPSGPRWLWPYGWLYELAPGWDAVRVPQRIWTLGTLALALLAAAGAARAARPAARGRAGAARGARARGARARRGQRLRARRAGARRWLPRRTRGHRRHRPGSRMRPSRCFTCR